MSDKSKRPQILLTNDDGINSPGLWAAAEALSELGYVTVAAPREQSSGMGRSMPPTSDGLIKPQSLTVHGKQWITFAVGGTPAQTVQHAILEIMPQMPQLVVAGINYGNNFGTGVTISGTVGAALEAAAYGIPSLAVSLETDFEHHLTHSTEVDFKAAAYFTTYFARHLLSQSFPEDMQVLKLEVPSTATPQTEWRMTRLARDPFYLPSAPLRSSWDEPGSTGYTVVADSSQFAQDSDVYASIVDRVVAVTPLSQDLTARVDLSALDKQLRNGSVGG
jgi:5'-nucleotidase